MNEEENDKNNINKFKYAKVIRGRTESELFKWIEKNKRLKICDDVDMCLPLKITFVHFFSNREANKRDEFTLEDMILYLIRTYKKFLADKFLLYSKLVPDYGAKKRKYTRELEEENVCDFKHDRWLPFTLTDILLLIDNQIVDGVPVFRVSLHPQLRVEFANMDMEDLLCENWTDIYARILKVRMLVPNYELLPLLFFKEDTKPDSVNQSEECIATRTELMFFIETYNFGMECLALAMETTGLVNHRLYLKQAFAILNSISEKLALFASSSKILMLNGYITSDFTDLMFDACLVEKHNTPDLPVQKKKRIREKVLANEKLVTRLIACSLCHCGVALVLALNMESAIVFFERAFVVIQNAKVFASEEKSSMYLSCIATATVCCNKMHFHEKQKEFENKISLI